MHEPLRPLQSAASADEDVSPRRDRGSEMLVLRFIGSLFLMISVIALTADLSRAPRASSAAPAFTSLLKHWSDFAPQTLSAAQKTVQTRAHPLLWDPLIRSVLIIPAWISLGMLAVGFLYLGRPRRRVDIFVN